MGKTPVAINSSQFNVRVPNRLREQFSQYAAECGLTLNTAATVMLHEYLVKHGKPGLGAPVTDAETE